jgi:hypothetical protein
MLNEVVMCWRGKGMMDMSIDKKLGFHQGQSDSKNRLEVEHFADCKFD